MRIVIALSLFSLAEGSKRNVGTDHPTLPTRWKATTNEPGAGLGVESYLFEDTPSSDNPSAMWSNYTDCERLIYVTSAHGGQRYLLGCESLNCCYEEQDGNQVEFQIPNVHYSNPTKTVNVSYQRVNITNFNKQVEADEWSWQWAPNQYLHQEWFAYTVDCDECVGGVKLLQWGSSAAGSEVFSIEFQDYVGYDDDTTEGQSFKESFQIPEVCTGNILACPSNDNKKGTNYREIDRFGSPLGSTCTGPHESCCEAPLGDVNNCPASARTDDCDAINSCCCG